MTVDLTEAVAELAAELSALGTPERAAQEKRYLKSPLAHYGVRVPQVRRTVRDWWRNLASGDQAPAAGLAVGEVLSAADLLWAGDVYELRSASVELLRFQVGLLGPLELPACERRIRESGTWALVDTLATDVVGPIVSRAADREVYGLVLDRWSVDECFWVRRAALLSQLPTVRTADGDTSRFCRYADNMLDEREFFIRKAIGWVLREISKKRPELVFDWLSPRLSRISGVTFREATKYLPASQAQELTQRRLAAK